MPNKKNLKSFADMNPETARAIQSEGGKASGEKRREKKRARELAEMLLDTKVRDEKYDEVLKEFKIKSDDKTYLALMLARIMQKIIATGDITVLERFLVLAGQNPSEQNDNTDTVRIIDDI